MTALDLMLRSMLDGGPYAISLAGWLAWYYERRVNKESAARLLELATAQVQATVKHEAALEANTKLIERFWNRGST